MTSSVIILMKLVLASWEMPVLSAGISPRDLASLTADTSVVYSAFPGSFFSTFPTQLLVFSTVSALFFMASDTEFN